MATRLKTIEYAFSTLASIPVDNTLTALTQITAYIPEFSGTVTFKSVIFCVSVKEGATMTTGNYDDTELTVSLGGATAVSYKNLNTVQGSGENQCYFFTVEATDNFITNWTTGTSKTVDASVRIDFTHTTIAAVDVDCTFSITYEYDDTQTTQIKTVRIPLNAPTGALATSKPGSATATIPALDTELPESSKTYRQMFIVAQGNIVATITSTTDHTQNMQIDSLGTAWASSSIEMGAISDYWIRFVWNVPWVSLGMTTNTSHSFYIWANVARFHHPQVYLVVTYEFDASGSTDCFNSVLLPCKVSIIGGSTSADYQRLKVDFWIQEPATITTKQVAFFAFWEELSPIVSLYMRLGADSFVSYTDAADATAGSIGAMCRSDTVFTLARGKNTLNFDIYRTDTGDFGPGLNGYFIVNYTSGKPTQGYGAANHTVIWGTNLQIASGVGAFRFDKSNSIATAIPETNYFMNSYGCRLFQTPNSTLTHTGTWVRLERNPPTSSGEWLEVFNQSSWTDAEAGLHQCWANCSELIYRFPSDPLSGERVDPETSRRWEWGYSGGTSGWKALDIVFTYHSIYYTISGEVSLYGDADGAGLLVGLYSTDLSLGHLGSTITTTGGDFTFVCYDNTKQIFAECFEDVTHCGRSISSTAY